MARPNPIRHIMESPLPSATYQRRKSFRPSLHDINYAYNIINKYVFDNALVRPYLHQGIMRKTWGYCQWHVEPQQTGSYCSIKLSDKWFCPQWFMNILAHEMVHQYQWDVHRHEYIRSYGKDMHSKSNGHGPSFYAWRDRFEYYGLNLKVSFSQRRWFKYQDFNKS